MQFFLAEISSRELIFITFIPDKQLTYESILYHPWTCFILDEFSSLLHENESKEKKWS